MKYKKLVRDNIPDIIAKNGEVALTRVLGQKEYIARLIDKLSEEYREFLEDMSFEELADILEVIYALADEMGGREVLENVRKKKFTERGGFTKRVFLESTGNGS